MRKRFNFGRLGALALALTLITSCLMGGTLAKYTSKAKGTGTATVAQWKVAFKANDTEIKSETLKFDLKDTGINKGNVKDGVIAPDSTGSIPIVIDASGSEVAAELTYTIDRSSINAVPIKFYSDESCTTEIPWTNNKFTDSKKITADATGDNAKFTTTLYWKWISENDDADTKLGSQDTAETGTISITLSAEQTVTATSTP